jgi:hypothetical protein
VTANTREYYRVISKKRKGQGEEWRSPLLPQRGYVDYVE